MGRVAGVLAGLLTAFAFFVTNHGKHWDVTLSGLQQLLLRLDFIHTSMVILVGLLFAMAGALTIAANVVVGPSAVKYGTALVIFGGAIVATGYYTVVYPDSPTGPLVADSVSHGSEFLVKKVLSK